MRDIPVDPALLVQVANLRRKLRLSPEQLFERALRTFLTAHGVPIPESPQHQPRRTAKASR